jgi:hypothetical protein
MSSHWVETWRTYLLYINSREKVTIHENRDVATVLSICTTAEANIFYKTVAQSCRNETRFPIL